MAKVLKGVKGVELLTYWDALTFLPSGPGVGDKRPRRTILIRAA
jgi:hypothetical protein